ncbi:glucose 1-dehydrogenase [Nocardia goodfellowii]|uniref:3alpha(Or 20beta)-hydroxysteroid dehydrogenase n=1 Tax=Nocardia goodfellowii TaxID=882446 RepID=A0ABS4QNK9_9NOCA|nr:glucose 1-dehydrogenase [Nocardia goodfellowii]MBP2192668.1 3alpha(or 20beta)-hydroxysteroid dehydrogenase [Nocardia goodfellowii]
MDQDRVGRLAGKVALITGGARGMGAEHVRRFVAEGARVVFGDVLDDAGRRLAAEIGPACHYLRHDVTSETDWAAAVGAAQDRFGRLDVLVNNAGILRFQSIADMPVRDFSTILTVNVTGTWLGIKSAAPALTASGGGSIVNISSVEGFIGAAGLSAYSASKFAIRGVTKSASRELGKQGIRVNSVHPGGIATPMTAAAGSGVDGGQFFAGLPISRWGQPAEVTEAVVFLASDAASYCTGTEIVVDGGMLTGAGY